MNATLKALEGYRRQRHAKRLSWCDVCHERSVRVKLYRREDGTQARAWICINAGHGLIEAQALNTQVLKGGELNCGNVK